jgi:NAD(P)-dependent dehydrogenase (short-subunit alcohol dehydrogenase family)
MPPVNRRVFIAATALSVLGSRSQTILAADVPRSRFDARSTAEDVTAGIDLSGKTAVVTGCNSGIGYETMRVLALRGAHVIGTARTPAKGREACASIEGLATPATLELTDFDSVVACANEIRAVGVPIDMLILNAGIVLEKLEQVYGLEKQFVVNHLGHFVLTKRLLDLVQAAPQGRVVVVGSRTHLNAPHGGIQFDELSGESWFESGYEHSKLANGLFSLELARRLRGSPATSNCVHPGGVRTNILRNTSRTAANFPKSPEQGAATTCYVATNPALTHVSGEYFADCNPAEQGAHQTDTEMAAKLWEVSTKLASKYLI